MQQQRIPDELVPTEEVVVGDPIIDNDGLPEWVEQQEWVHAEEYVVEWGTHTFEAATAISPTGETYTQTRPSCGTDEAPPAAEAILRDLVARGGRACYVAVSLATGWGIDLDELGDAGDRVREAVV